MNFRIPSPDLKITDLLSQRFTLSVEVVPPRNGVSPQQVFSQIDRIVEAGADFLAVTKGAGGSLRGGSLPIAQMIKDQFQRPCIAHFTCRDLLPEEVENHLVDHHFVGIRNILALRGDPPMGASVVTSREGAHQFAHQLVRQIKALNRGEYLLREGFKTNSCESMDFCVGVACYPDLPGYTERVEHLQAKVDAGAEFAISQMLFGATSYECFLEECAQASINIPILPGTCVFRSQEQAVRLAKRFEIVLDSRDIVSLPKTDQDAAARPEAVVENFVSKVDQFKKAGAPGLHAFLIGSEIRQTERALQVVREHLPRSQWKSA